MERVVNDMKKEVMEKAVKEMGMEKTVKEDEGKAKGVLKKEREVVFPGDKIIESMDYLPGKNCFREGDSIYSKRVGVVYYKGRVIEVIPLSGEYIPEVGDMVIGTVKEVHHSGWNVNINSPYEAFLSLAGVRGFIDSSKTDLSKIYGIGDLLYAEVSEVTPMKDIRISMKDPKTRKFEGGRIVRVSTVKVPRVIGKQGSMINMIKEKTGCMISVGQNGMILVQGEKENLAAKAITEIQENSQITGLTDHIGKLLSEGK
ncbi:MAG: exosome complex RNA-binding protein Rrp4 [Candidatus Aenigmarchaeota archaeon]